jgi:ABC-2 type transport system permease protein
MRRLARLVGKDLRRTLRAPLAVLAWLSFPVIFAGLLALTFGSGGEEARGMARPVVFLDDRDGSALSRFVHSAIADGMASGFVELRPIEDGGDAAIEALFRRGEASALLRIPQGFEADWRAGRPLALELVRNPAQGFLPEIVEQGALVLVEAFDGLARLHREQLVELAAISRDYVPPSSIEAIDPRALEIIESIDVRLVPPFGIPIERLGRGRPDGVGEAGGDREATARLRAIFLLVLPGVAVWALFMLGDHALRDVLAEEKLGTLRRQLTTPLGIVEIVAAKTLYAMALAAIGLAVLAIIGFGATGRTVDLAGFIALGLAVILAVCGLSATLYGLARTERQGATLSSAVILAFSFIGGAFIPAGSLPEAVRSIAPLSPVHWAVEGFRTLEARGGGVQDTLAPLGLLGGFGLALLLAGSALLGRRLRRAVA